MSATSRLRKCRSSIRGRPCDPGGAALDPIPLHGSDLPERQILTANRQPAQVREGKAARCVRSRAASLPQRIDGVGQPGRGGLLGQGTKSCARHCGARALKSAARRQSGALQDPCTVHRRANSLWHERDGGVALIRRSPVPTRAAEVVDQKKKQQVLPTSPSGFRSAL